MIEPRHKTAPTVFTARVQDNMNVRSIFIHGVRYGDNGDGVNCHSDCFTASKLLIQSLICYHVFGVIIINLVITATGEFTLSFSSSV